MYPYYGLSLVLNYLHDIGAVQPIEEQPAMATATLKLEVDATDAIAALKQAADECDYVTRAEAEAIADAAVAAYAKTMADGMGAVLAKHASHRA